MWVSLNQADLINDQDLFKVRPNDYGYLQFDLVWMSLNWVYKSTDEVFLKDGLGYHDLFSHSIFILTVRSPFYFSFFFKKKESKRQTKRME
jgi:hypothetical protein